MDASKTAPDNAGDQCTVPAEVVPGRAKTQQNDAVRWNGVEKGQPAVRNVKRGDDHIDQQRNEPNQQGRQPQNDVFVGFAL